MSFIKERNQDEQANVLAQYLPNDPMWNDKNADGTPLRKILLGLAAQWLELRATGNQTVEEYDIRKTTLLLEEWEKTVGIPDCCLTINNKTLEQRRTNVLLKLAGINATTAKQFKTIAMILGYDIDVNAGKESPYSTFPMTLPFILMDPTDAIFSIVVTINDPVSTGGFPLTLPFTLASGATEILSCLFDKLKPANSLIFFNNY